MNRIKAVDLWMSGLKKSTFFSSRIPVLCLLLLFLWGGVDRVTAQQTVSLRPVKYLGITDCGFSELSVNFGLAVTLSSNLVCENAPLIATATVNGVRSMAYSYYWYKLTAGSDRLVADTCCFELEHAALSDSGRYYCKVVSGDGRDSVFSDTLVFVVRPVAVAEIVIPTGRDTTVCPGDTLTLVGSSSVAGASFSWDGIDILDGFTEASVRVSPKQDAVYWLTTDNGGCFSRDTVTVRVNHSSVFIPPVIHAVKGIPFSVEALDERGALADGTKLTWWRDDVTDLGEGNPKQLTADASMRLAVVYDQVGCRTTSAAFVNVKRSGSFTGGADDGFSQQLLSFSVEVDVVPSPVCENESATFRATVSSGQNTAYSYYWYKLTAGSDRLVADSCCFELEHAALSDSGRYYCKVVSGDGRDSVFSDTLVFVVRPVAVAEIVIPMGRDTTVCPGDTLTLVGSSSVAGASFSWDGIDILDGFTEASVRVSPKQDAVYLLTTDNGGCFSRDTVTVRVNHSSVFIPPVIHAVKGIPFSVEALDERGALADGTKLTWWRDDVTDLGEGNPKQLTADASMRLTVVYDQAGCRTTSAAFVNVKRSGSFTGGADDGFSQQLLSFNVEVDVAPSPVCENESATFRATVSSGQNTAYSYCWYKWGVGSDRLVADTCCFELEHAALSDSGRYYCKVVSGDGRDSVFSDTLVFVVRPVAVAEIVIPMGRDTTVCPGDTLTLVGSSSVAGASFSWDGIDILDGFTEASVRVSPKQDAVYWLTTDNGGCFSRDTVTVRVNHSSVLIPPVIHAVKGIPFSVEALDERGALADGTKLTWWRDDVTDLGEGNPKQLTADASMRLAVVYDQAGCRTTSAAFVNVKRSGSFTGGADDGFSQQLLSFSVEVDVAPSPVCENESATFRATVNSGQNIAYSYYWYKLTAGSDRLVADTCCFELEHTALSDSGRYYCKVVSGDGRDSVFSDTLVFVVRPVAVAEIVIPMGRDTTICPGDTLTLVGSSSVAGASFSWDGIDILDGFTDASVRVSPKQDAVYLLTTDNGGCFSRDTVTVHVNHSSVFIPPVIHAVKGIPFSVEALDERGALADGTKLTWWRDDVTDLGEGNPKQLTADASMRLAVVYDQAGCRTTSAAFVNVKRSGSFTGDADDGFSELGQSFKVVIELDPDTVCAGEPVAFHAAVKGLGRYNYSWYRVTDTIDLFVRDTCCFELADVSPSDSGLYFCVVQDISTNDSVVSDTVLLFVRPSVQLDITVPSGRDTTVCAGTLLILEAESDDAVDSLRWNILNKDGTVERQTLPGGDGLEFAGITAAYDSCFIWCEVAGRCGSSDTVLVRVDPSGVASLKPLADNRFGQCDSINLRRLLAPRLDGVATTGGYFSVDSVYLPGDWWSRDSLRVGCHSVRFHYAKEANRCINVPEMELCIDTLPTARILLADNTCPGGRMDSLKVVFTGSAPLSFTLEQQRFKADGTHQKTTVLSHTLSTGNRYDGIVSWLDSNAYIVYKLIGVEDRYGCTSVDTPVDTIRLRPTPMFSLYSRYPHREDVAWNVRPGWQPYTIPSGDSVGVKVVLTKGTPAWNLLINDQRDASYIRRVGGIQGLDTTLSLVEARTYQMRVARDSFCPNYMDSKYVSVAFRDTGYIRMRVILEGAYNADSARMLTGRDYRMPDYGIQMPLRKLNVTGREVIDWLTVELRTGTTVDSLARMDGGSLVLTRDTCLLLSDGTVVDREGNEAIGLRDGYVTSDSLHRYHIVLYHRNHLSVMTRMACFVSGRKDSTVLVDFTSDTTVYWSGRSGSLSYHMSEVDRGKWALSAGEVNANGLISIYDPNGTARGLSATPAYHPYDVNFDGVVDWPGWNTAGKRQDWYLVKMNKNKYSEIKMGSSDPGHMAD